MASIEWFPADRSRSGAEPIRRENEKQQAQVAEALAPNCRTLWLVALVICSLPIFADAAHAQTSPEPAQTAATKLQSGSSPDASKGDGRANTQIDASRPPVSDERSNLATSVVNPTVGDEDRLTLADVIASLYRSYPEIARAQLEADRTQGEITEAYGFYDTKLQGYTLSEPTGFYRNYRNGIGVARQTWWGGYLSAGYRIGRGQFQPWYKERETNEGGEFKLAIGQALLQGRAIDPARVQVFQANIARRAAEPIYQQAILQSSRDAAVIYWQWVAAGKSLAAQQELFELAKMRGEQFEVGVKAGIFAEIDLILNRQLIAERQAKMFESEQKFRSTSFKLSLYLRNDAGQPIIPEDPWLPARFPIIEMFPESDFQQDLANALTRRPEPKLLMFEIEQIDLDRRLASNNLLPSLDMVAEASQDAGVPASSLNDKGQFELVVGLQGEVPIQRRKARGKLQSTNAKIAQVTQKLRLQRDKIGAELQTAYNALMLAAKIVEQSEISLRAAWQTLGRYRFAFERGKIDLIYLNLLETKANETEIKLIDAQQQWFSALAEMQAALGLDPLDQAMLLDALPMSDMPGPGNLPAFEELESDDVNRDWERRNERAK